MASETISGEEQLKERFKWSENIKVYTRNVFKKNKNPPKPDLAASVITFTPNDTHTSASEAHDFDKVVKIGVGDGINDRNDRLANGVLGDDESIERDKLVGTLKTQTETAETVILSQTQHNSSRLETVSEDSSTLNRPIVTRVDDRVSISVSGASSKKEAKELKRKLESQLDQVRIMTKRLEDKEIELCEYKTDSGVDRYVGGHVSVSPLHVHGGLQNPGNGGLGKGLSGCMRVNSEMSSIGYSDLRPFRHQMSVADINHGVGNMFEKERTPKANQYYRNSEFLCRKENLRQTKSNRKSKSIKGKRRGGRELDSGLGIDEQVFKSCSNLLQKLMKHKYGWVFNQPVDVKSLGLHDYFDIIKHPMDLGTVKNRLMKNLYKTPREFAEDVRLTFHNAMTYNPEGQDVHIMAKELLSIFEDKWTSIQCEYDRRLRYETIRDLNTPTPTSRKTYAQPHAFTPVPVAPPPLLEVRHYERSQSKPVPQESSLKPVYSMGRTLVTKKPKAKDSYKRDMTFDEKQRLSTNLQSLPPEKLDDIVRIIKKRNSALSQHDDEIEVDIDSVDAETLWELDSFVTNYNKRKAETNETRQDEGNAPTSPRGQLEKHGGSGTDSSSNDSEPSSSDSDSDSSSDGGQ